MESILDSIKKLLGITDEYKHFDVDIIMHINTAFLTLQQLGVGPKEGYSIQDEHDKWEDYLPLGEHRLESVKTYIYLKVKLAFDPPQSSSVTESYNRMISELEWRISVLVDELKKEEEESEDEQQ